jgi:exopolysaccharide biosynthesis polyprenyl glycosylphosphotransferase
MPSDISDNRPAVPQSNSRLAVASQSSVLQAVDVRDDTEQRDLEHQLNEELARKLRPGAYAIQRRAPSPAYWHLTLVAGDTLLIVPLIVLMVAQVVPDTVVHGFASFIGEYRLFRGCLAFISWGAASGLTQPRSLLFATNRFKSSLIVLFTLALMFAFWYGLTWLLVGLDLEDFVKKDLFFLGVAIPIFCVWRIALAECMRLPRFRQRAVIVGVNSAGVTLVNELQCAKHVNLSVLGYIADEKNESFPVEGLPVLGDQSVLRYMVQHGMLDTIVMTLDHKAGSSLFQEVMNAALSGVAVVPMSVVYERIGGKIPVEHIGDQWFGELPAEPAVSPLYFCWRKGLDIAFGMIGTAIMLAVLPIIALCIYLDAPGPIFYRQERVGHRGKPFYILKFRSMRVDAEQIGTAIWAAKRDMRVTRVGRLLRATHLDELPQVINILRGEMSLIGPRPERQIFVDRLATVIPFYHCRLSVLPGLTGWAQVKYPYASSDYDALVKLQYDLYYVKRRSFLLDVFILSKTVVEVLFCRGR